MPPNPPVYSAVPDDREPRRRPKMFFFDRIKLLLIIAIILTIMVAIGMQVVLFWVGYFNNIGNMLSQ